MSIGLSPKLPLQLDQGIGSYQLNKTYLEMIKQNFKNLLLRPDEKAAYTYLGRLKYLRHDPSPEKPVYFQWQLVDWEPLSAGLDPFQNFSSKPFRSVA